MKYLSITLVFAWATVVYGYQRRKWECGEDCLGISKNQGLQQGQNDEENLVNFYLYNKNMIDGSERYSVFDSKDIQEVFKKFEPQNETKIIIHGWLDNLHSNINVLLKDGYLTKFHYNTIIADWSEAGSMIPVYPAAKSMIPIVSNQIAMLIDTLYIQYGLVPEKLHLIGHSLGAHIAGITGNKIGSGKIGRITGLDPAGPLFSIDNPKERINKDSALFVDVVHTNGRLLGASYPMGHADFFPNGGNWWQPGCCFDIDGVCSHARSYLYFAESIKYPFGYQSTPCSNWKHYVEKKCDDKQTIPMGAFAPISARGSYFLKTNSEPPYFKL